MEADVRRLQTPRGGLWYDREYGTDLRSFVNSSQSRFRVAGAADRESVKDERVHASQTEVTIEAEKMRVNHLITLDDGPFQLVLNVSALKVELVTFG